MKMSTSLLLSVVCLFTLLTLQQATASFPFQCTFPDDQDRTSVRRHRRTPVCVAFNQKKYTLFDPEADELSRINVNASALSLPDGTGVIKEGNPTPDTDFDASVCEAGESTHYVSIDVLSLGASSDTSRIFQKWDCENDEVTFYSVITAIVHVKDGKPDFISYDDGCFFCGDRDCDETGFNTTAAQMEISSTKRENCGITCSIEDIKNDNCGKCDNGACDLKVYVVWTGKDSSGEFFTSAGQRFSRFRQFNVGGLSDSARTAGTRGISGTAKAAGDAENLFS